ncbi:MAG: hypothetical protein Q8P63_01835 [Candidatus Nealsonbacteria bacterium]|nr:hypothetical protein [Candidatus Nealsonbacteria bacterium]
MKIKRATEKDFKKMMNIAKKLHPKWFDNFAINKSMPLDLKIRSWSKPGFDHKFFTLTNSKDMIE